MPTWYIIFAVVLTLFFLWVYYLSVGRLIIIDFILSIIFAFIPMVNLFVFGMCLCELMSIGFDKLFESKKWADRLLLFGCNLTKIMSFTILKRKDKE